MAAGDHVSKALQKIVWLPVAGLLSLQACASYETPYEPAYSAEAIEIRVIDAVTSQPIEGVIAVAHWELKTADASGQRRLVQLKIFETVTDKNGRLFFPAWGPERNPATVGYVDFNDPGIILFKSGYTSRVLQNHVLSQPRPGALRYSDWNGNTVSLTAAPANEEAYLRQFRSLNQVLESIVRDGEACNWKKLPTMLRAVQAERQLITRKGITGGPFGIGSVDQYLINNAEAFSREGGPACGSPLELFESGRK
jgi:hypothetical protein